MKTLQQIFDDHNCDKGSIRHRYDRIYEPALEHLRDKHFNMLEVGILRGESLSSWVEFFPKATIYAIDIFTRVPAEDVQILNHPNVKWCNCNSIEGPNKQFNDTVSDIKFDVIIDDGLHTHDSQRQTFENFISYLSENGVYFIEDVWAFDHMNDQQKQHHWLKKNKQHYSEQQYNKLINTISKYNYTYHDVREGFEPDSFIIEIRK